MERSACTSLTWTAPGKAGRPTSRSLREIAGSSPVPVQYGGGVRDVDSALKAVEMGVDRVVVGTAAVEDPSLVGRLLRELGAGALIVSVDARGGKVALGGWTRESGVDAVDFAGKLESEGVERVVYTDISRDGTLTEPNFAGVEELAAATRMKIDGRRRRVVGSARIPARGPTRGRGDSRSSAVYTGDN